MPFPQSDSFDWQPRFTYSVLLDIGKSGSGFLDGFCIIRGEVPTYLPVLEKNTAPCIEAALDITYALPESLLKGAFATVRKVRVVTNDNYAANFQAERMRLGDDSSWALLHIGCATRVCHMSCGQLLDLLKPTVSVVIALGLSLAGYGQMRRSSGPCSRPQCQSVDHLLCRFRSHSPRIS